MLRDKISEIGNPEKLDRNELETGIEVLDKYIEMCEETKVKIDEELAGKMHIIEHDSAIAMYDDCVNSARRMKADYRGELDKKLT